MMLCQKMRITIALITVLNVYACYFSINSPQQESL